MAEDMWKKSRTRLTSMTERQRQRALRPRKTRVAKIHNTEVRGTSTSKLQHCPAVNYTGVYTRGYSCEHAAGHEGLHRDKHMNEW